VKDVATTCIVKGVPAAASGTDTAAASSVKDDVAASSVKVIAVANSVNDVVSACSVTVVAVANSVNDAAAAGSVEDVALFKGTSKEPLSLELEASSIKDSVALMLYILPLITCFLPSTRAVDIWQ
jgi:hypothetical protein